MYLVYADESGDPGQSPGGTSFFVVSGLIIHETKWNNSFKTITDLRRKLRSTYGVGQRIAWHATDIVNAHGDYHHSQSGLSASQRFAFYREILETLAGLDHLRVLNVFIRKDQITGTPPRDLFEWAWELFIQRLHNSLGPNGALPGKNEHGLLITDRTHDDQLRRLHRRMRAHNPVPSQFPDKPARQILAKRVLEDPVPRASQDSYFVQAADLIAFALARRDYPRANLAPYGFSGFFNLLDPILLKEASRKDPQGVVFWPA